MKQTLFLSALAALLILASCERRNSDLTFSRIVAESTITDSMALKLAALSGNTEELIDPVEYKNYDIEFPATAINEDVLNRLRLAVINSLFSDCDTAAIDIEAEMKHIQSTMKVTKSDSCPVDPLAVPEDINATSFKTVSVRTITNTKSLYTFCLASDEYSFGAIHGFYSLSYHSYNSTTGELLTFDSLFTSGADTVFLNYMRTQIPVDFKASYGQEFIFQDEPLVSNATFYFTPDGIHFSFPPYRIGSYADGQIDCLIPADKVKPLLKPQWQKLFDK